METAPAPHRPPVNPSGTATAIRAAGLRKVYQRGQDDLVALEGLDLTINQGEFFGLLGTNGAGKSTTIGMLTTLVAPTAGRAWVAGHEVGSDPVGVKSRIGVVPQANTLDRALTVLDNLAFRGRYFGMSASAARRRALELLEQFALADKAGAEVHQLSGGQARRVMIGRALMHLPEVRRVPPPRPQPPGRLPHPDRTRLPAMTASPLTSTVPREQSSRRAAWRAYRALTARDLHVLGHNLPVLLLQVGLQPLLFTFAFAYVMPSIGSGPGGATSFSTILLPGLMAGTLTLQSIMSVTGPLAAELGPGREIADRALAPLPVWALGLQKITSSAIFGLVSSLLVVPIVWLVHAPGAAPRAQVGNWPLLVATLVLSALLASTLGLLLGTAIDASAFGALLGLLLAAGTMLGCVYYPWTALDSIGWVQVLTLVNPLVYMSEGLRANLTPATGHLPTWAYLTALTFGTAAFGHLALRRFTRRVRT